MADSPIALYSEKVRTVRHHVLSRIEAGEWPAGSMLPGARELATALGISFPKVQQALETLALDGVLETRARVGTVVQANWQERVLRENLCLFAGLDRLPWLAGADDLLARELPGLRLTTAFREGLFEIKTTLHVQANQERYLDLAPFLAEAAGDPDDLFPQPFAPFRVGGRLVGVPIIFSPWVICYQPEVLRRHGCAEPQAGWTWEDLLATVRRLAAAMPRERVLNWSPGPHFWLPLVVRSGGALWADDAADPVRLDHPGTLAGLRRARELGELLGFPATSDRAIADGFLDGSAALALGGRQFMSHLRRDPRCAWGAAPLPVLPGGVDAVSQSTDLACVRATCPDPGLARTFLRTMLSRPLQERIGAVRYGIPVRKSAAAASVDLADPRETLILSEMGKMRLDPCPAVPGLARFALAGIDRLLREGGDLERGLAELAAAVRLYARCQRGDS